jgi:ribosomal protein S18 acetylase RimI-like enzyme
LHVFGRKSKVVQSELEIALESYPKTITLKDGFTSLLRPLETADEPVFYTFFQAVPERERMFIKHRIEDPAVIHAWCQQIDLGHKLPLLAWMGDQIAGACTLHQQLGGWKRHIGRVSVLIHPQFRGRGLAIAMISEVIEIARNSGLERMEAEFIGEQSAAIKMFALLGFQTVVRLPDYVKDMQAVNHDYILMGLNLETDEEFASAG